MATKPATSAPRDEQPAQPSQRRPVRLLLLGRFEQPTYLTAPRGDRRRFVVERPGTIRVVQGGRVLGRPFLDISDRVTTGGESGLLSMAFARDYRSSRRFWVYYTDQQGFIQIDQFRASAGNPDRADPGSRRSVLRVPHHRFNHKGGQLQVGPDGMLYAGFGDGGAGGDPDENAQNLGRMLGKLIRIDPKPDGGYRIPPDNPFRNRAGALPEIYAYGVRNPYRFSFDRRTGSLTIGDVGQDEIEEIDFIHGRSSGRQPHGGYNFGWDSFEGRNRYGAGPHPSRAPAHALVRLLFDHRRLRPPRPLARPRLARSVRVRRPLRRHAAPLAPAPPGGALTSDADEGEDARVVRRGRPRARVRGVAGRACVSDRAAMTISAGRCAGQAPRFTQTVLFSR